MSTHGPAAATRLRESIAAGLDDLDALLDVVDAARDVVAHYATVMPHGEIDRAVSSLKEALTTLDYVPTGEGGQSNG